MSSDADQPPSDRMRVRRGAENAAYDPQVIREILDAGLVAHVGVATADGPVVVPMAYGRTDDEMFLHGAVANAALTAAVGADICATVTIVDGLVVARAPFHNTMRYRSVVVRGVARRLDGEEKVTALRAVTDHVVSNWDTGREPTAGELRATLVLSLPLVESSAKVRAGGPHDDDADLDGPHWAGTLPIERHWGPLERSPDLSPDVQAPPNLAATVGRPLR